MKLTPAASCLSSAQRQEPDQGYAYTHLLSALKLTVLNIMPHLFDHPKPKYREN